MAEVQERVAYQLNVGDEVAIMPLGFTKEWAVLDVVSIGHVLSHSIQLTDGRLYARHGGRGLTTDDYIVPATHLHRAALMAHKKSA